MTPKPLGEIRLRRGDHLSALWWLALIYRKPRQFQGAADALARRRGFLAGLAILLHSLPYTLLLGLADQLDLAAGFHLPVNQKLIYDGLVEIGLGIVVGIVVGIVGGIVGGIGFGIGVGIGVGIVGGMGFGIVGGIGAGIGRGAGFGIAGGIVGGIDLGIGFGIVVGISVGIGVGIVLGIGFGIGFAIVFGIVFGIDIGIGGGAVGAALAIAYSVMFFRLFYQPLHWVLVWPRPRPRWYARHPVCWDDVCLLPFADLDRLLVAYHEISRERAESEINRLIDSYPTQRHQALRARARLLAREAAAQSDMTRIVEAVQQLPTGDKAFLTQTGIVKEAAARVAQLQARTNAIDRPVFREVTARQLVDEIDRFRGQVSGLREPLASEFRAAALAWKQVAERQLAEVQSAVLREPVHQVFHAGAPVNRGQEAFIPRVNVIGKLEQQVMLATGCPGVILYGLRRRGKSSALRNLTGLGLLPVSVRAAIISMQEPKTFFSIAAFAGRVAQEIAPESARGTTPETLPELFDLLGRHNQQLASRKERLILALDEYENIDLKIGEGVFSQDLLAAIRESIQTHRNITWLFAGSHAIEELPNAPWTSYLVSARTIEVPNFSLDETRLLLTEPMKYSPDWARDSADRPRFDGSFWSEGGIERIQHETDGWPHLVQLIAETCVDLVNEGGTRMVTPKLLEKALDEAIVRGHTVMYELMHRESELPGEWQYLSGFRERETQPAPDDVAAQRSLLRREVAIDDGAAWRLRVPLMGRWLRRRG
jgi:hypothetical protein